MGLWRRFDRWAEGLSSAGMALLLGLQFFVVWAGIHVLFDTVLLVGAVFGAALTAGAYYWFDSR